MTLRLVARSLLALFVTISSHVASADQIAERKRFLEELNTHLLGVAAGPLKLDADRGWRSIVMAPPGTSVSTLLTPFAALTTETVEASRLLEAVNTFDRPLAVTEGIGSPSGASLPEIWKLVLERTRPPFLRPAAVSEGDPEVAILFRQADAVDQARGIAFQREPSEAVMRYREYEYSLRSLAAEEISQTGLWRLNSRLSRYGSISEAKAALAEDWVTYGYKREVDSARIALEKKMGSQAWQNWSSAEAAYKAALVPITPDAFIPRTVLFPPPSEWLSMANWLRLRGPTSDPGVIVSYDVASIRIIRTWFLIDQLVEGRIQLRKATGEKPVILSDGLQPTTLSFPSGLLAAIPENIVLVRNVRFIAKSSMPEQRVPALIDHPLGLYAYPDDINLFGYVARTLPRLSN